MKLLPLTDKHEIDRVDRDPQDGAAVGDGVLLPRRPGAELVTLLRVHLQDLADGAALHNPPHRQIRRLETHGQQHAQMNAAALHRRVHRVEIRARQRQRLFSDHVEFARRAFQNRGSPPAVVIADGHQVELLGGQQLRQCFVPARLRGVPVLENAGLCGRVRLLVGHGHQFHVRQLRQNAKNLFRMPVKAGQCQTNLPRKPHFRRSLHLGHQGAAQRPGE